MDDDTKRFLGILTVSLFFSLPSFATEIREVVFLASYSNHGQIVVTRTSNRAKRHGCTLKIEIWKNDLLLARCNAEQRFRRNRKTGFELITRCPAGVTATVILKKNRYSSALFRYWLQPGRNLPLQISYNGL